MIAKLKESPAMRKLMHNRGALVALSIIALYILLFVWIICMQALAWVGNETGSFDLAKSPVLGAMLPERTLERVGARNLPGFGIKSDPDQRSEQLSYYFELVGGVLNELERPVQGGGLTRAEILGKAALAERRVADLPSAQLREIYDRGQRAFVEQGGLRVLRANLLKLELGIEEVRRDAARLEHPPHDAKIENLRDDLSLAIENIGYLLEDAQAQLGEDAPLSRFDPGTLIDAADAILEDPLPEPLYDEQQLNEIYRATRERQKDITAQVNQKLDAIEPIVEELYPMPTGVEGLVYKTRLLLGTDRQGRSILIRSLYSAKVAIQVGLVVSVIAVFFGSLIGAAAGFFGSWVDHLVIWLYSTFSSIPYLVLLVVLAFMFIGSRFEGTLIPLYSAFCLTFWIGPCRITRGEALKLKALDYVQAANALGASRWRILTRHILPNTAHLMFINLSLLFIGAIKGEVVLTFLGLGLKEGASWGIMINQSKSEVVSGFFWQIGAATFFMFVLVLAFNVLTDALQDAFDPKHVG